MLPEKITGLWLEKLGHSLLSIIAMHGSKRCQESGVANQETIKKWGYIKVTRLEVAIENRRKWEEYSA
jgi:hypothetical protein